MSNDTKKRSISFNRLYRDRNKILLNCCKYNTNIDNSGQIKKEARKNPLLTSNSFMPMNYIKSGFKKKINYTKNH